MPSGGLGGMAEAWTNSQRTGQTHRGIACELKAGSIALENATDLRRESIFQACQDVGNVIQGLMLKSSEN